MALVVVGVCLLIAAGCDGQGSAGPISPKSVFAGQPSLPVVLSEPLLNLGEVPAGGQKQRDFWLTNQTASPVDVAKIETSCDCLTIELPNRVISPGQKVTARALLDLQEQPGFTGKLGIEVSGKAKSGQVVFTLVVKVAIGNE